MYIIGGSHKYFQEMPSKNDVAALEAISRESFDDVAGIIVESHINKDERGGYHVHATVGLPKIAGLSKGDGEAIVFNSVSSPRAREDEAKASLSEWFSDFTEQEIKFLVTDCINPSWIYVYAGSSVPKRDLEKYRDFEKKL